MNSSRYSGWWPSVCPSNTPVYGNSLISRWTHLEGFAGALVSSWIKLLAYLAGFRNGTKTGPWWNQDSGFHELCSDLIASLPADRSSKEACMLPFPPHHLTASWGCGCTWQVLSDHMHHGTMEFKSRMGPWGPSGLMPLFSRWEAETQRCKVTYLVTELTNEDSVPEPSLLPPSWSSPIALGVGPHLTRIL